MQSLCEVTPNDPDLEIVINKNKKDYKHKSQSILSN